MEHRAGSSRSTSPPRASRRLAGSDSIRCYVLRRFCTVDNTHHSTLRVPARHKGPVRLTQEMPVLSLSPFPPAPPTHHVHVEQRREVGSVRVRNNVLYDE